MVVWVACFCFSSYLMSGAALRHSFSLATSASYAENKMLQGLLLSALETDSKVSGELLANAASSASPRNRDDIYIRISDSYGRVFYSNFPWPIGRPLSKELSCTSAGYRMLTRDQCEFIVTSIPLAIDGSIFIIEALNDVSEIFANTKSQYNSLFIGCVIITTVCEIALFAICWFILKPLTRLSDTAKHLADGEFYTRIYINNNDETGILAASFNEMAERVEAMVCDLSDDVMRQERFIGYFAHELKTPLTSIIGYADMLRSRRQTEESTIIYSNYVYEEGMRLESMSMKLLEMIYLRKEAFEFRKVLTQYYFSEICCSVAPMLNKREIQLNCEIEDAVILIEPDLMKTVFLNIIDNSAKAITRSGRITITGNLSDDKYLVSIQDNGKGMTHEELSHITDEFYMADKISSREQGGVGLGLAVCSEIIQLHNAKMVFSSVPQVGTIVTVHLKAVTGK